MDSAHLTLSTVKTKAEAGLVMHARTALVMWCMLSPVRRHGTLDFFADLFAFLCGNVKWWLTPIVVVLLLVGILLVVAEGSALAPFIYTVF